MRILAAGALNCDRSVVGRRTQPAAWSGGRLIVPLAHLLIMLRAGLFFTVLHAGLFLMMRAGLFLITGVSCLSFFTHMD